MTGARRRAGDGLLTCGDGTPVTLAVAGVPHVCPMARAAIARQNPKPTVSAMLTRTSPLPPVSLADPIWTFDHLEVALRLGERATRTLIADRAFPAGFRLNEAASARRYWLPR